MTRLERIDVRAFRGIVDAQLPFGGGSVVLGGGNGMGKTAFVDALEFLYTGGVSSLSGAQGISLKLHGPHIQAGVEDSGVTGVYRDPDMSCTRFLAGPIEVPVPLEEHMAQGRRLSFILRRAQLQQFIHATPAD